MWGPTLMLSFLAQLLDLPLKQDTFTQTWPICNNNNNHNGNNTTSTTNTYNNKANDKNLSINDNNSNNENGNDNATTTLMSRQWQQQ